MPDTGTDAHRWERRTAPELRALAEQYALVVLPVASMEQHGPHLPVWTDSFIGHACALHSAAEATDVPPNFSTCIIKLRPAGGGWVMTLNEPLAYIAVFRFSIFANY